MSNQVSRFDSIWLIVPFAIIMYVIPWVFNQTVTLSLGAYDFAEFLAKRPFDDLSYNTILALRGQLVLFAWLIAASISRPIFTVAWWVHVIACFVLIVAQLPPLTFFINTGDMNQQQQAILASISLVGTVIGMSGIVYHYRYLLRFVIGVIGLLSTIYAMLNAIDLMRDYGLSAQFGIGGIGLAIIYALLVGVSLLQLGKK